VVSVYIKKASGWAWWLKAGILATQEAELESIMAQGHLNKWLGGVAHIYHLSYTGKHNRRIVIQPSWIIKWDLISKKMIGMI
jgi:hypothetical protein